MGFEMELPLNENIAFTGMALYRINEFFLLQSINRNPAIPLKNQTVSSFENKFNPLKYTFKLGIKIKI